AVYRSRPLERRLGACLRSLRVGSEDEAKALIAARPELLNRILSTLLIGVTEFFRDPLVFASLREIVVPELGRRTSAPRVLSVGCANGAELYSVAILLAEAGLLEGAALF